MQPIPRYQPTFAERYPIPLLLVMVDLALVIGAGIAAYFVRFDSFSMPGRYSTAVLATAIVAVLCLTLGGVYGSQRGKSFLKLVGAFLLAWGTTVGILLSLSFFLKVSTDYSRLWFITMLLMATGATLLLRVAVYLFLRRVRAAGRNLKTVLLVGGNGATFHKLTRGTPLGEHGFKVQGTLPFESGQAWLDRLAEEVNKLAVHEVWLCLPLSKGAALPTILYALRHHTVGVRFFPEWGDMPLLNHKVSHIAGLYSLDLSCSPMDGPARFIKRAEDILIGGLISLLILPVCVAIAIAIKATSPGPVVFKQYRTGINGKKFKVYKFRSMVVHQESNGEVTQAKKNDARVTPIGAFLRRTSLDELPQFFNVLQGRMSLVGPRPHALAHNEYYKDLVESYMQRHKVKPGITGWAQVNGYRGETDTLDKMQKRVEYDLWYIDNWSLWLDLKIIFLTVFKGFINKNAY